MKKILKSNSLFVLLLMIYTGCIARFLENPSSSSDRFRQLIPKYLISDFDFDCMIIEGPICICENQVYGTIAISSDGPETECLYVSFSSTMNISNTDESHQHHYNGNHTAVLTFIVPS